MYDVNIYVCHGILYGILASEIGRKFNLSHEC